MNENEITPDEESDVTTQATSTTPNTESSTTDDESIVDWTEIEIPPEEFQELPGAVNSTYTFYVPFPRGRVETDELTPYQQKWLFVFLKDKGDRFSVEEFLSLTYDNISMEDLRYLRSNKFPKPPNLANSMWMSPTSDHVTVRQRRVIDLRALGKSHEAIAEETGLSVQGVRLMLASPWMKAKVAHKQTSLFENDAKQYMKTLMNKSYGVIDDILDNEEEKSSVRLEAAKFVVDHVIGKAQQTVEHKGSLLVEFMNKLDERPVTPVLTSQDAEYERLSSDTKPSSTFSPDVDEPKHYDTTPSDEVAALGVATAKPLLADMKSAMDTLVDSVLKGKTVTVGKRST